MHQYIHSNWLQFVEAANEEFMEHVDDTIPWLPPKVSQPLVLPTSPLLMTKTLDRT